MPLHLWINIEQERSLTTRIVFHVAFDGLVQVGINVRHFWHHLLMTLESFTGFVVRHT